MTFMENDTTTNQVLLQLLQDIEFEGGSRDRIKRKETSSYCSCTVQTMQLEILSYVTIIHQPAVANC